VKAAQPPPSPILKFEESLHFGFSLNPLLGAQDQPFNHLSALLNGIPIKLIHIHIASAVTFLIVFSAPRHLNEYCRGNGTQRKVGRLISYPSFEVPRDVSELIIGLPRHPRMRISVGISLQFGRTRVIHGIAVITAKGERTMNGIPAETANTQAAATAEQPTPAKKPHVAAHRAHVAPSKARSGNKATPAKKANKGATSAKSPKKATGARQGSKTAKVLDLLKRSGGASLKELRKATGWQVHSVRGFLSGTLGRKMGLAVTSTKAEEGERRYSVKG
jgi:hypothetical protein